jgi:hypothetical protein
VVPSILRSVIARSVAAAMRGSIRTLRLLVIAGVPAYVHPCMPACTPACPHTFPQASPHTRLLAWELGRLFPVHTNSARLDGNGAAKLV